MKHDPEVLAWGSSHPRMKILCNMDTLIIDEVSMGRADVMDAIDQSLRLNMGKAIPFGGKQLIFIGDIFQLSPVVAPQDKNAINEEEFESPYF